MGTEKIPNILLSEFPKRGKVPNKILKAKHRHSIKWRNNNTTIIIFCAMMVLVNGNYLTMTSAAKLPVSAINDKKVGAAGNIGCLFGQTICDQEIEWCYDDYAFGRCLPISGSGNDEDMYRYELSKGDMHILEKQMERLFALGYRWGHLYTQCVLQNLLDTIRQGGEVDETVCLPVQDQDLEGALKAFQDDIDPWNLAFIKYSPSAKNPHSDFADETYKPAKEQGDLPNEEFVPGKEMLMRDNPTAMRLQDRFINPIIDFSSKGDNPNMEQSIDAYLAEKELENTVAQVKGKHQKGKNKSGKKNKNKNKNKTIAVKKSRLNLEYPGQSDNFNGVDIGSTKKNPTSPVEIWGGSGSTPTYKSEKSLIDNRLKMDGEAVVDSNGVVNDKLLQPRIFSSSYNTPDTFRFAAAQPWSDPLEALDDGVSDFDLVGLHDDGVYSGVGNDYDPAPSYRYDDRDYRGRQEELRLQQEEEDQQIRKAVATLQAELLLLSLLKDNVNPENEVRSDENVQRIGVDRGVPTFPMDAPFLPPESHGQADFAMNPELDDGNLLYTEGGLVFLNKPQSNLKRDYNNVDDESLNFLKRYVSTPNLEDFQAWGHNKVDMDQEPLESNDENVLLPMNNDIGEYAEGYGYDFGSPLFLLNRRNRDGFGFERRERLDVKKPGPWYRTVNNYAFDKDDNADQIERFSTREVNPEFGAGEGPADMMGPNSPDAAQRDNGAIESEDEQQQINKKSAPVKFDSVFPASLSGITDGHLDIIDTSYVNVFLQKSVNWKEAKNLVDSLAYSLDLDRTNFKDITTNNDIVTFKVEPNDKTWNASEVARRIQNLTGNIESETGIRILRADVGIRATSKQPSKLALLYENQDPVSNQIYVATFAVCGLVAAILVAAVAIFLIRKHSKSREKLVRLSQDDPSFEACKDYQDLCRARMAGSKNNEKMEPIRGPAHKIASKESENGTNSSRSSTSSWSEEPVLTNMDISTGHMVLSYMEDHLKNRDRINKEWGALCAYEADPCSTAVSEKSENSKKNRYSNSLPFDHSRVILNDLANVTGSDYVNASTITDHDPRNPAYIATQGPLPNTAADFWQMVWEQGSVVIVNLTRLTENTTALCHRYWPEEGSELHHIYEVHLVSEHIWCDEYLVRSFYLKNLKTGETRTVTQFHFLAWPENGIPQSTKALLEFRRKVNKSYRGRSCPIIVHCSDGAGRTGTYCLIDMVLNRMTKGAKEIDIAASLEHIRDQRPAMVRTKQQFEFVLMAVAEEVHAILKALPQ